MAPNSTNNPAGGAAARNQVDDGEPLDFQHASQLLGPDMPMIANTIAPTGLRFTSVADFYRDRCILITGATGFMGKVLVEKLLRSCSSVGTIFLLMRPRGNVDVYSRLEKMLECQLFDNVRASNPEVLTKLKVVAGDIMLPGLGLSPSDTDMLAREVSVVFHAAATVKFDEAIKLSLQMNVLGTRRMVELCKKMTKLVSVVHVSTAYCNCDRKEVQEQVYPPPSDPDSLIKLIDLLDDDLFTHLTSKLVGNRPNTYTFTKALAEHVLVTEAMDLPLTIVRPSIVAAAWREPIPGWVDNYNGPTGLIVGAGKGLLRTLHCHQDLVADLIPVDIPINLLIVAACHTALYKRKGEMRVYNCVSGMENPVTWRQIRDNGMVSLKREAAMAQILWYPSLNFTSSKTLNSLGVIIQHWLPAYVLDGLNKAMGKKAIMIKIAQKLDRAASCLEYFTTHEWKFNSDNVQQLWAILPSEDRKKFNFCLSELDWNKYMHKYCAGTKRFVLKEDQKDIQKHRTHLNRLLWAQRVFQIVAVLLFWRTVLLRSETARNVFYALLRTLIRMITYLPIVRNI